MIRLLIILLVTSISTNAMGLSCVPSGSPQQIDQYKHIFIARVVDSTYVPNSDQSTLSEGVAIGYLFPIDTIKGDPEKVPYIEAAVESDVRCAGCSLPYIATGYTYAVFAKEDGKAIVSDCRPTRRLSAQQRECFAYEFRQRAAIKQEPDGRCDAQIERQRERVQKKARERRKANEKRYQPPPN